MGAPGAKEGDKINGSLLVSVKAGKLLLRGWIIVMSAVSLACAPSPAPAPAPTPSPTAASPSTLPSAGAVPASPASSAAQVQPPERPRVIPADTKGMVLLPGGTFYAKDISKTVTVTPFWLDTTEVTVSAYQACVTAGKCTEEGIDCDDQPPVDRYRKPGRENHPINCVNQVQAAAYCAFAGKRLPTGAEWEWAARGTTQGSTYPWGEAPPDKQLCWKRVDYQRNTAKGTCPVHSFPRGDSPQGIADLAGNVDEWTTSSKPGRESVHGGNWMETDPGAIKAGVSDAVRTDAHIPGVGFRCAGDEPTASP